MVTLRRMKQADVPELFAIAMRAFLPDYERYGVFPPVMNMKKKRFLPPLALGKTALVEDQIIGGIFALGIGKRGEIGSIFVDPAFQNKGYGRQIMLGIEAAYPRVTRWKLEVLAEKPDLHRFYESLGYLKIGERTDETSGLTALIYEANRATESLGACQPPAI